MYAKSIQNIYIIICDKSRGYVSLQKAGNEVLFRVLPPPIRWAPARPAFYCVCLRGRLAATGAHPFFQSHKVLVLRQ